VEEWQNLKDVLGKKDKFRSGRQLGSGQESGVEQSEMWSFVGVGGVQKKDWARRRREVWKMWGGGREHGARVEL
jgi:hypothetical protein